MNQVKTIQSVLKTGRTALQTLGGLFFPPLCPCCLGDSVMAHTLCPACEERVVREVIEPPFCAICSRPFRGAEVGENLAAFVCNECRERRAPAFIHAVAGHLARGVVREMIHAFKYQGRFYLRRPLTAWLLASLITDARLRDFQPDGLVAVPLHPRRQRTRGYNQAAVLAAALGRRARLLVFANAVRRVRDTPTQTHLSREERIENLCGAFLVPPAQRSRLAGQRLLLLDDVFTTGSTVNACARALSDAGAAEVRVLAVARG